MQVADRATLASSCLPDNRVRDTGTAERTYDGAEAYQSDLEGHDDINLERNQFGRKSGELLGLPLGRSVFDHEVATLYVTEVTQSLTEGLCQVGGQRPS